MATLLERMGGVSVVLDMVDRLHAKMNDNQELAPFMEGVDLDVLGRKQTDWLGRFLGEASEYDASALRNAHQRLVDQGLSDRHFDITLEYIAETLRELEVSASCVAEITAIVQETRDDVLCKPAP